jgi:hypothetical protein
MSLTDQQQALISAIGEVWITNNRRWPNYGYVERVLDQQGLRAEQVIASLPSIGSSQWVGGQPSYGLVWFEDMKGRPDKRVGLTVAGLAHLPEENQPVVGLVLLAVGIMANMRATAFLDPFGVEEEVIGSSDLARRASRISPDWVKWMPDLFRREPCVWGGEVHVAEDAWLWRLGPALRNFLDVRNLNDYLWRTANLLTGEGPAEEPENTTPSTPEQAPEEDPDDTFVRGAPKVFLSHASEDKASFVEPMARELRRHGVDAWLDKWELHPGDSLVEKIFEEGLGNADAFVVVISEASLRKPWVREELDAAVVARITKNSRLIPIRLGDVDMPTALTATLWEDATNDAAGASKAASRIVRALLGRDSGKPALGAPPAYLATASAVPGLNAQDAMLLMAAVEQAIQREHLMLLDWPALLATVDAVGLDADGALESLHVLSTDDYFDTEFQGEEVMMLSLTGWGYNQGWSALRPDHDGLRHRIAAELLNASPQSVEALATAVREPTLVVERILSDLQDRGLVSYTLTIGGSVIHTVNPALRRHLQT